MKMKRMKKAMKNNKKILILDGNLFAFRAYMTRNLETSKGVPTSVISGILQMLKKMYADLSYDRLIICWDGKGGSALRQGIFPEYKANRKESREKLEPLFKQIKMAKKFFKVLNVRQVSIRGVEGDDIMGIMSRLYAGDGLNVIIASADKDLLQLIDEKISVFRPTQKEMIDLKEFKKQYGIMPKDFIKVKSLMGDTGDNVPGVMGIGEKRALEIVKKYPTLKDLQKDNDPKPFIKKVQDNLPVVNLAYKLVKICRYGRELGIEYEQEFSKIYKRLKGVRFCDIEAMMKQVRKFEMKHRNFQGLAKVLSIILAD